MKPSDIRGVLIAYAAFAERYKDSSHVDPHSEAGIDAFLATLPPQEEGGNPEQLCSYAELRKAGYEYAQDQWKSQSEQIGASSMIEYAKKDFIEGGMFVMNKLKPQPSTTPDK